MGVVTDKLAQRKGRLLNFASTTARAGCGWNFPYRRAGLLATATNFFTDTKGTGIMNFTWKAT